MQSSLFAVPVLGTHLQVTHSDGGGIALRASTACGADGDGEAVGHKAPEELLLVSGTRMKRLLRSVPSPGVGL